MVVIYLCCFRALPTFSQVAKWKGIINYHICCPFYSYKFRCVALNIMYSATYCVLTWFTCISYSSCGSSSSAVVFYCTCTFLPLKHLFPFGSVAQSFLPHLSSFRCLVWHCILIFELCIFLTTRKIYFISLFFAFNMACIHTHWE